MGSCFSGRYLGMRIILFCWAKVLGGPPNRGFEWAQHIHTYARTHTHETELLRLGVCAGRVYCCRYSPDTRHLLSGGIDARAVLWDSVSRATVVTYEGHMCGPCARYISARGFLVDRSFTGCPLGEVFAFHTPSSPDSSHLAPVGQGMTDPAATGTSCGRSTGIPGESRTPRRRSWGPSRPGSPYPLRYRHVRT